MPSLLTVGPRFLGFDQFFQVSFEPYRHVNVATPETLVAVAGEVQRLAIGSQKGRHLLVGGIDSRAQVAGFGPPVALPKQHVQVFAAAGIVRLQRYNQDVATAVQVATAVRRLGVEVGDVERFGGAPATTRGGEHGQPLGAGRSAIGLVMSVYQHPPVAVEAQHPVVLRVVELRPGVLRGGPALVVGAFGVPNIARVAPSAYVVGVSAPGEVEPLPVGTHHRVLLVGVGVDGWTERLVGSLGKRGEDG